MSNHASPSNSHSDPRRRLIRNSTVEFLIFTAQDGSSSIKARYEDETVWLTQKLMAELFGISRANVAMHLRSIYDSGELDEAVTCQELSQVRQEGIR